MCFVANLCNSLVPSFDNFSFSNSKFEWRSTVSRRVKLATILQSTYTVIYENNSKELWKKSITCVVNNYSLASLGECWPLKTNLIPKTISMEISITKWKEENSTVTSSKSNDDSEKIMSSRTQSAMESYETYRHQVKWFPLGLPCCYPKIKFGK